MDNANLPDPVKVFDMLMRHAAAYKHGCFDHHDGEIFNRCPYFAMKKCSASASADAAALIRILLSNQSESSPYYGTELPS